MDKSTLESKVTEWRSSGLSQVEFCRRNSINPSTFYNAKVRLLGTSKPSKKQRRQKATDFVQVIKQPKTHVIDIESVVQIITAILQAKR